MIFQNLVVPLVAPYHFLLELGIQLRAHL